MAEKLDVLGSVKLRRKTKFPWGQYASTIVICAAVISVGIAFAQGQIEWSVVGEFFTAPSIMRGVVQTAIMAPLAMIVAIILGLVFAIMKMSANPVMRWTAVGYIWIFRAMPQLLQLYLWFNLALVFPFIGIAGLGQVRTVDVMTPFVAALIALSVCQSAYTAEVIRSGLLAVDPGQTEAAQAIGMGKGMALRRIVLPQTLRVITPPVGNEFIGMIKATSLASAIQFSEVLHAAQRIYYTNNRIMELLIVATLWYLILVTIFSFLQSLLEKRLARGYTRQRTRTLGAAQKEEGEVR